MRSVIFLIICAVTSRTDAVPNILQDTWNNILTKFDYTVSKCPELMEPPYTTNIPHETDCAKFYICQKGKKIEMTCPSFLEFNAKINICDWPKNANCQSTKTLHLQQEPKTTEPTAVGRRRIECEEEDQHIPHESACDQYYRCVYGRKVLKICPDGMVFNEELGTCDFSYNVICGSLTVPEKRDAQYFGFLDDYEDLNQINTTPTPTEGEYDYYDVIFDQVPIDPVTNECPVDAYDAPQLFAHETKCNAYYRCANGKKQLMFCPGMFLFNSRLSVCDWPDRVKCDQSTTSTTTTKSHTDKPQSNPCHRNGCRDSTVYLPVLGDARKFVRCDKGKEIMEYCPNGLVFDVELRVCNVAHLARTVFDS